MPTSSGHFRISLVFSVLFYGSVLYGQDKPYAVTVTDDAKSGKAARLETLHTGGNALVPKVTSGTVYCGTFIVVITNTL